MFFLAETLWFYDDDSHDWNLINIRVFTFIEHRIKYTTCIHWNASNMCEKIHSKIILLCKL